MIVLKGGMTAPASPFVLYKNLAVGATFTPGTTAAGYSAASAAEENTFQAWKAANTASDFIVDLGAAKGFDTVALAAHNLGSVAGPVALAWKVNAGDAWTYHGSMQWPADDGAIAFLTASPVTARYVLVKLYNVTPAGPAAPVVLGVLSIGNRLELPCFPGPDFVRPDDAVSIDGTASLSLEGQYLGATIRRKAGRLRPNLSPIARTWADANLSAFRAHYDARRPFFYAPGPAAFPGDLVFGWRADGAAELRQTVMTGGNLVSLGLELDFYAA